jgi:putative nucleic acid modification protein with dual OB domain
MPVHELIITDVTNYGSLYCVAGWDRVNGGMIRPEPATANPHDEASRFWDSRFAGPGRPLSVGNIVSLDVEPPPSTFRFPHATEDRIVAAGNQMQVLGQLTPAAIAQHVALGVSPTLDAAFDGGLIREPSRKAYVPAGHNGRSLGALDLEPNNLIYFEKQFGNENPKLRARITVDSVLYDMPVTADATRERWRTAGIQALRTDVQNANRLHVRVGLARPFPADQCFSQVNGVLIL